MLPKAILFDLDDTIVSFGGAGELAWKETCDAFVAGTDVVFDGSTLLDKINNVRKWYWSSPERHKTGRMDLIKARREIVKMALNELQYYDGENAEKAADAYSKRQEELICLFPDSINTLKELKSRGIRMALVTNGSSETQRRKINRFYLSGYFEFCLIEEEAGYGKPDIRVYEIALEKLSLEPHEVWMVGDNLEWDVEAPQKAGIFSVWNDYGKKGLPKASKIIPDRIIHSISELLLEE